MLGRLTIGAPDYWTTSLHPVLAGVYPIPNIAKSIGQIEVGEFFGDGFSITVFENLEGLPNLEPLSWSTSGKVPISAMD